MAGKNGNGNGERIKTPLELEKEELRKIRMDFHPDKFMDPEDKKRAQNVTIMLNALGEIHSKDKKLISTDGSPTGTPTPWPKDTRAPKEIHLIAAALDGNHVRVNLNFGRTPATPQQFFDEIRKFHSDPAAYRAAIVEQNKNPRTQRTGRRERTVADDIFEQMRRESDRARHQRAHDEAERARQADAQERAERAAREETARAAERERVARERAEASARAAEEARKREQEQRLEKRAERVTLAKSLKDRFGVEYPELQNDQEDSTFSMQSIDLQIQGLKKTLEILEKVGPGVSHLRGLTLLFQFYGETKVEKNLHYLQINPREETDVAAGKIIMAINAIAEKARLADEHKKALSELQILEPFKTNSTQFNRLKPEQIVSFARRIRTAIDHAEHGWVLKSELVHHRQVNVSKIDDTHVRYKLSRTDPSKTTAVTFEIGIAATEPALQGLMDTAGREIEKFYPAAVLAPHKAPLLAEKIARKYQIAIKEITTDPKNVTPEVKLRFLERLQSAIEKVDKDDRHWLRNLTVMPPNEGTRVFGVAVGSRSAWVQKNQLFSPYDVSEESLAAALQAEVKKKKEA